MDRKLGQTDFEHTDRPRPRHSYWLSAAQPTQSLVSPIRVSVSKAGSFQQFVSAYRTAQHERQKREDWRAVLRAVIELEESGQLKEEEAKAIVALVASDWASSEMKTIVTAALRRISNQAIKALENQTKPRGESAKAAETTK